MQTHHLKACCSLPQAWTRSSSSFRKNRSELKVHSMHPQSAVGAGKAYDTEGRGTGTFRFWTDERRFKGPGSKCVVQEALFDAGGVRTGGYPKAAPVPGPLGYDRTSEWDLLWSPARLALRAIPNLKPGQLVSSCPGLTSITRKRRLSTTLWSALGDAAWDIMPRSFALPEELPSLCQYMQQQQQQQHTGMRAAEMSEVHGANEAGVKNSTMEWETAGNRGGGVGACGDGGEKIEDLWILKTAQHLGKGLKVVTASQLVEEATSRSRPSPSDASATPAKPFVQAQRYIADPLLIQGRKFGLRVWVLVCGCDPMRAYLHVNGLVLFATDKYVEDKYDGASGQVALGHVTNYAQNTDGLVWDMCMLEKHLGEPAFRKLWARITENTAHVCAAALPAMRADNALLQAPSESTFELLGFDFLVDSSLHPWLLEVNGTPSLTVEHEDPNVESIIRTQKAGMARDMVYLLDAANRFRARYDAMHYISKAQRAAVAAAAPAGKQGVASDADIDADQEPEGGGGVPESQQVGKSEGAGAAVGNKEGHRGRAEKNGTVPPRKLGKIALPRSLYERLTPRSDATVMERVQQEVQRAATDTGFRQLNPYYPGVDRALAQEQAQGAGQGVMRDEGNGARTGSVVGAGVNAQTQGAEQPAVGVLDGEAHVLPGVGCAGADQTAKSQIQGSTKGPLSQHPSLVYTVRDLALQRLLRQMR